MKDSSRQHTDWSELVAAQREALVRQANAILQNREDAEDCVQQTLLYVYRQTERQEVRDISAYASRAVYWNALKWRARRKLAVPYETLPPGEDWPSLPLDFIGPFELESAISQLSVAQQTVIRLRYYFGLTFREIGQNLSISTNTAASRSRYALSMLRRLLGVQKK